MSIELRKMNGEEKVFALKIIDRALRADQIKHPLKTKDVRDNLKTTRIGYDLDGNFTVCVLKPRGNGGVLITGQSKRNAKLDSYDLDIGKQVALRCAVNNLIGVSNEYARKHETRNYVHIKSLVNDCNKVIKAVRKK